jgi:hypothetical protein
VSDAAAGEALVGLLAFVGVLGDAGAVGGGVFPDVQGQAGFPVEEADHVTAGDAGQQWRGEARGCRDGARQRLERLRRVSGMPVVFGGAVRDSAGGPRLVLDRLVGTFGNSLPCSRDEASGGA